MDAWIVGIIVGVVELVITTVVGLYIKHLWDKRQKEKQELQQLRDAERDRKDAERCNVMKEAVHDEVKVLDKTINDRCDGIEKEVNDRCDRIEENVEKRYNNMDQNIELLKEGLQEDLYVDLVHIHDDYKLRGWCSRAEKQDYDKLYKRYHNLGQNGVADKYHNYVMNLPDEAPKGE